MGQNEESGERKGPVNLSNTLLVLVTNCQLRKEIRIDVALSSARMQKLAVEEQERLHARKVIALLLDCCRCLARKTIAFWGVMMMPTGTFGKSWNLWLGEYLFLNTGSGTHSLVPIK